ncbi:AAA family ATPase [Cupriavidus metallidurans]|uniref:AAA family ATPase n=1 Tax=Cupriavidus metallidurans TaxID=119219 RepID=UPI001CCE63A5|nr:AAA family ATPase [Cupriavidus metallidurans]UBM09390.1 AAA family ATPase [Cupriavidus metallidurans]
MAFEFAIKTATGNLGFILAPGESLIFVGANGTGKSRFAALVEVNLGKPAHRISAHRSLKLDPTVAKIGELEARRGLRTGATGTDELQYRYSGRWNSELHTALLSDFPFLIQALFAEQSRVALASHRNARMGRAGAEPTQFEILCAIWDRLLPHRQLDITGDDIRVGVPGDQDGKLYSAKDMSDGERAIFYMIGQALMADPGSVLIVDEPELHIHPAILSRLWDEIEAARPDCAFIFISHDLHFAATRKAQKFVLRAYDHPDTWAIEPVPEDTGFDEEITTTILGSRRPVLFVEGSEGSLDLAVYRACYPAWTIIPRGSCEEVIHAVTTLRANASLTRVHCAGIVDADDYTDDEAAFLRDKQIAVLPVSEIENLFLLPEVLTEILRHEGHTGAELEQRRDMLVQELRDHASHPGNQNEVILRYCRRRIDRALKKVDLSTARDVQALAAAYAEDTAKLDIAAIADLARTNIATALETHDIPLLLKWYNNKGLLAIACKAKQTTKPLFAQWIVRAMRSSTAPSLQNAIRRHLPDLVAR